MIPAATGYCELWQTLYIRLLLSSAIFVNGFWAGLKNWSQAKISKDNSDQSVYALVFELP